MHTFCNQETKKYEVEIRNKTDQDLDAYLFNYYPTMSPSEWADPRYRKYRRLLIIEMLKRGLITYDPGMGEPERR